MIFTGTLDNSGATTIDQKAVALIKSCAEAAGWTTRLSTTTGENHAWIGEGPGLSGADPVFCGVRAYRTISSSRYFLSGAIFTGYVAGATYDNQPGKYDAYINSSAYPHISLDPLSTRYYIFVNAQRITAVFVSSTNNSYIFHAGRFFQFAFPSEYPYPVVLLSSYDASGPFRRYGCAIYKPGLVLDSDDGVSFTPFDFIISSNNLIESDGNFNIFPIIAYSSGARSDVFGTIDGIYGITGHNLIPRSVIQVGGTIVDQTGMSDVDACNAINAAGGEAYIVFFHHTNRGSGDAFAVKWE